jgi:hypothetical protein
MTQAKLVGNIRTFLDANPNAVNTFQQEVE